jgi:hypothetical protein
MKNPHDVIIKALVTEKGTRMREGGNKYLFQVHPDANKVEIQQAVQLIFGVRCGRRTCWGRSSGWGPARGAAPHGKRRS